MGLAWEIKEGKKDLVDYGDSMKGQSIIQDIEDVRINEEVC
jgi:hypothetical protein